MLKQVHVSRVLQLPQHHDIEMEKRITQHQNAAAGVITVDPVFPFCSPSNRLSALREWVVLCTVSASHPPGLHVVTDNLLNTAAHHCLSVLCYVPPWASFSVIDVFVYMSLFTLHPFLLTYQQSFSRPIFSFSEAVYNCWFFPDSTQLLTGSPWYDLLALLPVNTLIDNEMCVTRIHDSQR